MVPSAIRAGVAGFVALGVVASAGCTATTGTIKLYQRDVGREIEIARGGAVEVWLTNESPLHEWRVSSSADVLVGVRATRTPEGGGHARFEARREGVAVVSASLVCRPERTAKVCRDQAEPWRVTVRVLP